MKNNTLVFTTMAMAILSAGILSADTVYDVTLNTVGLNGTTGALDFTFGSGLASLPATATISTIAPLAGVGAGTIAGDAAGSLNPGLLTINNTPGYNDFFAQFTFTNELSFTLAFSGLATTSPDPAHSPDGSTFAFSVFDHSGNAVGTDPFGFLVTVDLNSDGSLSTATFAPEAVIVLTPPSASVPEPNPFPVLFIGLLTIAAVGRRFAH